jgi:hypothetical protein
VVLFCQMDVTGRTEADPAAAALARNLLRYAAAWKPAPRRKTLYAGDAAGKAHHEAAGLSRRSVFCFGPFDPCPQAELNRALRTDTPAYRARFVQRLSRVRTSVAREVGRCGSRPAWRG